MSDNQKTERINVLLTPPELERLDTWGRRRNLTRADAVRTLLKHGMTITETPAELVARCIEATQNGMSLGQVFADILEDHPLIENVSITNTKLEATFLRDKDSLLLHSRSTGHWSIEPVQHFY